MLGGYAKHTADSDSKQISKISVKPKKKIKENIDQHDRSRFNLDPALVRVVAIQQLVVLLPQDLHQFFVHVIWTIG